MSHCDSCGQTYHSEKQHKAAVIAAAAAFAKAHNTPVALYQEGGGWNFGTLDYLTAAGIPFREIISQYTHLSP